MSVMAQAFPNWRDLAIHESSPGSALASKIWRECSGYTPSAYDLSTPFGSVNPKTGCRTEDLERQTFANESFDLVITQDVFEHLFDPWAAAREIARTLKPGGAHIFTVPIVRKWEPTRLRAERVGDGVIHILEPEYHADPFNREAGALVTIDWGYDIAASLDRVSGMQTIIIQIDDLSLGIRAEFIEVLLSRKPF